MTDAEFEALCRTNSAIQFERTREGVIRMNPPTGLFTGDGNAEVIRQLRNWWMSHRRGRVTDSSTGFYLPDGSLLSPDAAYLLPEKLKNLTKDQGARFPHLCPDFVVDLLSESDSLIDTEEKMERWIENGAQLAWLIDPYQRRVSVYQRNAEAHRAAAVNMKGTGPVEGFTLDLSEVWRCFEI